MLETYARDPVRFHVLGKHVIVFWSLVAHVGLWLLARPLRAAWWALVAVLLLGTMPLDVRLATLIRTDTHQSALLVWLCLFLVRGLETKNRIWFAIAGGTLGLAVAVKWPSVVACLPIALATWFSGDTSKRWPPSREQCITLGLAALVSVLGLLLVAPYILLDFGAVLEGVRREARPHHLSATSPGFWSALGFYMALLWSNASVCLVFAPLAALALRAKRGQAGALLILLFVVYLLFISSLNLRWDRWLVPLLPYTCLFVVVGLAFVAERVRVRTPRALARRGTAACLAVITGWSTASGAVAALRTSAQLEEYARERLARRTDPPWLEGPG